MGPGCFHPPPRLPAESAHIFWGRDLGEHTGFAQLFGVQDAGGTKGKEEGVTGGGRSRTQGLGLGPRAGMWAEPGSQEPVLAGVTVDCRLTCESQSQGTIPCLSPVAVLFHIPRAQGPPSYLTCEGTEAQRWGLALRATGLSWQSRAGALVSTLFPSLPSMPKPMPQHGFIIRSHSGTWQWCQGPVSLGLSAGSHGG